MTTENAGRGHGVAWLAVASTFTLSCLAAGGTCVIDHVGADAARPPSVFAALDAAQRPPKRADGTTVLLADSESTRHARGHEAIMLVRLSPDRTAATVVSIPCDISVPVPGRGTAGMCSTHAFGGPALLVRTIEKLTGVRVDHFAMTDLVGFRALTRVVGGIAPLDAGVDHVVRQQDAMRALISKIVAGGVLSSPSRAHDFADAVSRYVRVDDTFTDEALRSLAFGLRDLRPSAVTFVTAPVSDAARAGQLWEALRQDQITRYLESTPR